MTTTSTQRWLIPALIVVVSLTVGGGLLARELYSPPPEPPIVPGAVATSGSLTPEEQPGGDEVFVTADAAAHPDGDNVRGALQIYFRSINQKNFDLWASVAAAERLRHKSRVDWQNDYKSTKDGSILIYRIEAPVGSLRVLVGFTSTQAIESAPPDFPEPCIRWRVVLPMVNENGTWKIDQADGSTPEKEKC
ncbi:hypothetical protein AB5J62_30040 [Amycolatopsis sp. cg5]|uniref:hypothetical protein n=1 Tax=Amycolatopsis sp. cg5 TaxID=3238802 RepID=UPI003523D364